MKLNMHRNLGEKKERQVCGSGRVSLQVILDVYLVREASITHPFRA